MQEQLSEHDSPAKSSDTVMNKLSWFGTGAYMGITSSANFGLEGIEVAGLAAAGGLGALALRAPFHAVRRSLYEAALSRYGTGQDDRN